MEKLTYRQAFDKITEAYIRGEIKPFEAKFCFCGTLANNEPEWNGSNYAPVNYFPYSYDEYKKMELPLLDFICLTTLGKKWKVAWAETKGVDIDIINNHPDYEAALFAGMCAALEVLKEIHRARGEDVDEVPTFTKRELKLS